MDVDLSVENGRAHICKMYEIVADPDEAKKQAVATAWVVAKVIKTLPMDTSEKELERIIDKLVARAKKNMVPEELF